MVSKKGDYFQCDDCKLFYGDKIWAEKCEAWCLKHKSCNVEITSHRVRE